MQSRLLAFASAARSRVRPIAQRRLAFGSSTSGRTADPEIHAGNDGADPAIYPRDPEVIIVSFLLFSILDHVENKEKCSKIHKEINFV